MAGRPMMASRTTAMFGGRRKVLVGLLAVAATALLAFSYYLRVTEQFYGLPGFSYKGLEYPTKADCLLIAMSLALFFAGLWGQVCTIPLYHIGDELCPSNVLRLADYVGMGLS